MSLVQQTTRLLRPSHEPQNVNLQEITVNAYPDKQWSDLSHGQQADLLREALRPVNFLLDPNTQFMWYWDITQAVAMLFIGLVTPFEVIFMRIVQATNPLFWINRMVDLAFFWDMIMQFFTKRQVSLGKFGTKVIRDPWQIRKYYLKTWFLLDAVALFPFDVLVLVGGSNIGNVKFLRCIRLMRLAKLLRVLKASRKLQRWQDTIAISFSSQRLFRFCVILCLSSHWMACLWGLAGLTVGKMLCDEDGVPIHLDGPLLDEEVSWVTTLFLQSKDSPDDPCQPWHVYTAALHWSVMTITSIGYGDIVPVRLSEYWVGIFCMLIGGLIWAYIIGSVCSILSNGGPVQEQFETHSDALNLMLREADVDKDKRRQFREYLRESKTLATVRHFREVAHRFSPLRRGELLRHISKAQLESVNYLRTMRGELLTEVASAFEPHFFARQEHLIHVSTFLAAVERGALSSRGCILMPGKVFNLWFIISRPLLRPSDRQTISMTYSLVQMLHRDRFFEILEDFPESKAKIRRAAAHLALHRAVVLCAQLVRRQRREGKAVSGLPHALHLLSTSTDSTEAASLSRSVGLKFARTMNAGQGQPGEQSDPVQPAEQRAVAEGDVAAAEVSPASASRSVGFVGVAAPVHGRGGATAAAAPSSSLGPLQRIQKLEATMAAGLQELQRLHTDLRRELHPDSQSGQGAASGPGEWVLPPSEVWRAQTRPVVIETTRV